MNNTRDNSNQPVWREQLVAYLDGELDAQEASRVEQELAINETARNELRTLEAAWEQLDVLPREQVDRGFTRTTVEMVAVKAVEDANADDVRRERRSRRMLAIVFAGAIAASVIGFTVAGLLIPSANDRLLHDLRVVEHLDEYRQVDGIDFLRLLERDGEFSKETDDGH